MSSVLTLYPEGEWISFSSRNSSFVNCIKMGIMPASYRKYDPDSRCWLVYWNRLDELLSIAARFFSVVDKSALPVEWVDKDHQPVSYTATSHTSDYSRLYVIDDAPIEVVKAAYTALVSLYHPDHNDGHGNAEKLNEVISAYRSIVKSRH